MIELIRTADGENFTLGDTITAGDEITLTVRGIAITATVDELEPPDPEFCGCIHYTAADGKKATCAAEELSADWHYNGQPMTWDREQSDREDFDSGRWTQADTDSMERGRDLPIYNDAGEPL